MQFIPRFSTEETATVKRRTDHIYLSKCSYRIAFIGDVKRTFLFELLFGPI